MNLNDKEKIIEEIEKNTLINLHSIFKNSLNDFNTSVDRSLNYLDKIVLPIIMASKQEKSYNPFSEIIEKYVIHILIDKFEKIGYNLLPLGYSSDLTLENEEHVLNIDIKTANIENLSDFKNTINVGINQMSHVAKLSLNEYELNPPFYVYPNIPPFYEKDSKKKLILTYGLMFIYPSYQDLIKEIRDDYIDLLGLFKGKVEDVLVSILSEKYKISREEIKKLLEERTETARYSREDLIAESLIRGAFVHKLEKENIFKSLKISEEDKKKIEKFESKLKEFIDKLRDKNIKPIAIIAISLPNGLLKDKYIDKFVSGKDYARSARYHYEDGIFEILKEKTNEEFPRVIFIDINENYKTELKQFFKHIYVLNYKVEKL
ncbi:MAG: hypothetical protein ACP5U0_10075 [Caldisphaera sp.]